MQIYKWSDLSEQEQQTILTRPQSSKSAELKECVRDIIDEVRTKGDQALYAYTERFDQTPLRSLTLDPKLIDAAASKVAPATRESLSLARDNIEHFHRLQIPRRIEAQTMPGVRCYREARPISRIGLYVPGGSTPLPSTVLMLGVPALIAGNPLKILCTPPQKDGSVHPLLILAAQLCGIDRIFTLGGAQAIAAMAYGTQSIPKVDKIFGPGNSYVTEAKLQVASHPDGAAIDLPAGPSEVLVIADASARPEFIAADLLSQAEHGVDSQVLLLTSSRDMAQRVLACIDQQLISLPRRETVADALTHSRFIVTSDTREALKISDAYAPEHLILHVEEPEVWARRVQNAGSVFIGPWSPESVGDYASGTNHVLPTYGYARSYSGLSLEAYFKYISFQHLSRDGLAALGPSVEELARIEGLEAHRRAVSLRLLDSGGLD